MTRTRAASVSSPARTSPRSSSTATGQRSRRRRLVDELLRVTGPFAKRAMGGQHSVRPVDLGRGEQHARIDEQFERIGRT